MAGVLRVEHGQVKDQIGRPVVGGQLGFNLQILQVPHGPGQQVHIPENSRHAEFVLALQVGAVAPLAHHDGQPVFARMEETADFKLAGHMGHLAVAGELAVYI